ncbi:MAG: hypothetical protein ABJF50_01590 [Paracoccaceae bacterium]|uniref:hypothetical protein n=1 Tax=Sulfitobacter pontiacus TaxID=60137 RepID=UPI0032695CF0
MKRSLALTLAGLLLAACTPAQQDELARDAAKQSVRPVLAERLPGVAVEPAVDCVIDNASAKELLALAADSVTGPTASTVEIVGNIITRPDTVTCLASDGLPTLLGI